MTIFKKIMAQAIYAHMNKWIKKYVGGIEKKKEDNGWDIRQI
jgi:hypothetical protein